MTIAYIAVDGDNPTAVTIGDRTEPVPAQPADAPAARIAQAAHNLGHNIVGQFRQHQSGVAEVEVESWTDAAARIGRGPDHMTGRRTGNGWTGVLRAGRTILADCGHEHRNRDWPDSPGRPGATGCMRDLVREAGDARSADDKAQNIATAGQNLGRGFQVPASTIAKAKEEAPANVAAYRAKLAEIAAILAAHPLAARKPTPQPVEPTSEVGELPAWMCG